MQNKGRDESPLRAVRPEGEPKVALAADRVAALRQRVADRFYESPRVADLVARRILAARDL